MRIVQIPVRLPAMMYLAAFTLLAFLTASRAEVRSGFWTLMEPSADTGNFSADFSGMTPYCGGNMVGNSCTIVERDFYFTGNILVTPYGGVYDSAAGAHLQSRYISGKTIANDREGLFYLDSMMKQGGLQAPRTGYVDSIPTSMQAFDKSAVYFIKTSENRYAALIKTGWYIGGIDRIFFYWVYQPDTGIVLYKNDIVDPPDSLRVTLDVFSGRPNPVFTLHDQAGISEITRRVLLSISPLFDSTIVRTTTDPCNGNLGYSGLSVSEKLYPCCPFTALQICGGKIAYDYAKPTSTAVTRKYLYDKNSVLEKTIIRVCCANNLTSTDDYGTVGFCDLVPDSLKDAVPAFRDRVRPGSSYGPVVLKAAPEGISYHVADAGLYRIELFDVRGNRVVRVDRSHEQGIYRIDLHGKLFSPGVYLFKCSRPGKGERDVVVPLVIRR